MVAETLAGKGAVNLLAVGPRPLGGASRLKGQDRDGMAAAGDYAHRLDRIRGRAVTPL